jgi:hypothetical protein
MMSGEYNNEISRGLSFLMTLGASKLTGLSRIAIDEMLDI